MPFKLPPSLPLCRSADVDGGATVIGNGSHCLADGNDAEQSRMGHHDHKGDDTSQVYQAAGALLGHLDGNRGNFGSDRLSARSKPRKTRNGLMQEPMPLQVRDPTPGEIK